MVLVLWNQPRSSSIIAAAAAEAGSRDVREEAARDDVLWTLEIASQGHGQGHSRSSLRAYTISIIHHQQQQGRGRVEFPTKSLT